MSPVRYEIRVAGVLPSEALLDYEALTVEVERSQTVLHGPLRDQAALQGLLARLEVFGAQVVLVRRLGGRALPGGRHWRSGPKWVTWRS